VCQFFPLQALAPQNRLRPFAWQLEITFGGKPHHVMLWGKAAFQVAHTMNAPIPNDLRLHCKASAFNRGPENFLHIPPGEAHKARIGFHGPVSMRQPPDIGLSVIGNLLQFVNRVSLTALMEPPMIGLMAPLKHIDFRLSDGVN
jgi:hypothetical protein